jgi:hypothetical protein
MEINEIELASELAHEKLLSHWNDADEMYEETDEETTYTEEAQDIFNDYYDYYLTLIEKTKYENDTTN